VRPARKFRSWQWLGASCGGNLVTCLRHSASGHHRHPRRRSGAAQFRVSLKVAGQHSRRSRARLEVPALLLRCAPSRRQRRWTTSLLTTRWSSACNSAP